MTRVLCCFHLGFNIVVSISFSSPESWSGIQHWSFTLKKWVFQSFAVSFLEHAVRLQQTQAQILLHARACAALRLVLVISGHDCASSWPRPPPSPPETAQTPQDASDAATTLFFLMGFNWGEMIELKKIEKNQKRHILKTYIIYVNLQVDYLYQHLLF